MTFGPSSHSCDILISIISIIVVMILDMLTSLDN